jgi:hypothetical protein
MSINVEFRSARPGKCRWCKKEKDKVFDLSFADGSFIGSYCFADFKKALEDKLENEAEPEARQAIPMALAANGPQK